MELDLLEPKARLASLKDALHRFSAPASPDLTVRREDGAVQCFACGHRCVVKPGRDGVCRVRFNEDGQLLVPHGYVGALACDPIEKKPFFHVLPGSDALTFGMLGCDFHCGYCQNWVTSPSSSWSWPYGTGLRWWRRATTSR
jgi:pyruvate formate lyase activating enzyme